MRDSCQEAPRLGYRVKILYGLGEIANAIKVVTLGLYGLFFCTTVMGLPGTWVGAVGFVAVAWDAAIDPYIGHVTDGARGRSSRYRFMLIGALTMGVGYWAFFSPPQHLSTLALAAWLLGASLVLRTATSMYGIPYYALGANLSHDYHERTSIAGIRSISSVIGTTATASLSFVLFFPDKMQGVDPKLEYAGYSSMGLAFGLVMTTVALIALAGTLPFRDRLPRDGGQTQQATIRFFGSMWQALRNRSFRVLLAAASLVFIALAMTTSLALHYLTHYVKVSGSAALSSTLFALYAGGVLGMVFWLRICRNFDKHWLFVLAAVVTSALMLAAWMLFGEGNFFGTGNVRPLLIGYGIAGFFNCILWFVPQSMLADIGDESELLTGRRREGTFFGVFSFGQQISGGVALLLAGGLLEWFAGLQPGEAQQTELTIHRIGMVSSVVPAALFLVAAIVILRYRLTRSRVVSIQTELHARRVEAGHAAE